MGEVRGFSSLRVKLFLAFFLLAALITLAISYKLFDHMRTNHLNTIKRDLVVIGDLISALEEGNHITKVVATGGDRTATSQAANNLRQRLAKSLGIDRVYIWQVALSGEYVYLADSENTPSENISKEEAIKYTNLLPSQITQPMVSEIPGRNLEMVAYIPMKITDGKVVALVGLLVNSAAVAEDVQHFVIEVAQVALLALLIVGVISWWLARNFARRLSRLYEAMDEMAAGNLTIALSEGGQDEIALLASRLNQLAVSLYSEREEMLLSAIESLVAALEAKDAYTYGHSSQVSAMAYAIGRKMGLNDEELFTVRIAALLHDIGKIGIPDRVLNKPGRLDEEERNLIEQHPVIGAKILAGIPALMRVTEIVKHHHARWDGKGYPEALAGEAIPLGARIIAVADTYQAMTSNRPYRKGMVAEVAMDELRRCAGVQFDPILVEAFCSIQNTFINEVEYSS